jgi:hypothetical protein
VPVAVKCCTIPRIESDTQMLPSASTVTPRGNWNWPAPLPLEPNISSVVPVSESTLIRWFWVSAT